MSNPKKIFVTGATGNQGGAVVRNLLSRGFYVKAFVRDPAKLKPVAHENLEIVKGDLNDPASYHKHLQNVDGVFCNLTYLHGVDREIKQGLELVQAAKENRIKHFVYSSVIGNDLQTGIPHWESKNKIEDQIKASEMNYTILRPASLYENLLIPQVKSRIVKGKLVLPTRKTTVQQFISSEDIGRIAVTVFSNPEKYYGLTISLACEQMDGEQLADTFSKALGKQIRFQQLPGLITRLLLGRGLTKMFRWVDSNDACLVKDLPALKNEFPGMMRFDEWIRIHFK